MTGLGRKMSVAVVLMTTAFLSGCSRGPDPRKLAQIAVWEDQGWTAKGQLTALLFDGNEAIRERAALALGRVNDSLALDSLRLALLNDSSPKVRAMAAFALGAWQWQVGKGALLEAVGKEKDPTVLVPILYGLTRAYAREECSLFVHLLRHPDPRVRSQCAQTIDMLNRRELGDSIYPLLDDPDPSVRWMATNSLLRGRHERGATWAMAHCSDPDPQFRAMAYRLVGSIRHTGAGDTLLAGLRDPDPLVRIAVADAFLSYRDTGLMQAMLAHLEIESDPGVMQRLIRSMAEHWYVQATPVLQKMLKHPEPGIRIQATFALANRRDYQIADLIAPAAADPEYRVRMAYCDAVEKALRFGQPDPAGFVDPLELLCWDSVAAVRAKAINIYAGLGGPNWDRHLARLLHDPSPQVVAQVIGVIGMLHIRGYADTLHQLYRQYRDDPSPEVKWSILASATNLLPTVQIDSIRQDMVNWGMADPNRLVRWYTIAVARKFRQEHGSEIGLYQTDLTVDNVDMLLPKYRTMPGARLVTSKGTITTRLDADWAPRTVRQFIANARNGVYDRTPVNEWQAGQIVQLGDRTGDASNLPPANVRDEFSPLRIENGSVFWASQTRDAGRGSFAVALARLPYQDWRYAVFGQVTDGLEIARSLTMADSIRSVEIVITEGS